MKRPCPTEEELITLFDGEATENRAGELRAHLAGCAACREIWGSLEQLARDIAAPVPGAPSPDAVAKIMQRVADSAHRAPAAAAPANRLGRWPLALGSALVAAAAAAALWITSAPPSRDAGTFASRGAASSPPLRRDVGVTIYRAGARLEPLVAGAVVAPSTGYAVSYTNLGPDGGAFLMVFAVDAAGTVHWIHPAYLDPKDDPSSLPLEHAVADKVLPTAGVLEDPAPGGLRVVSVISPRPLRVSQIDALRGPALELASLRARFPDAELQEVSISLH